MTVEETARRCGVSEQELSRLEDNPEQIEFLLMQKLLVLFNDSLNQIYFGNKADCVSKNKSQRA
jgi:DNA-binding XRE family transcriptional regulator